MPVAGFVTVLAAALVAVALVAMLVAVARVLVGIDQQLGVVIGAVGAIVVSTEPVNDVVESIDRDLDASQGALTALLNRKAGGAAAAARLVASVDPLAGPGAAPAPPPPARVRETIPPPEPEPAAPVARRGAFRIPSYWQQ